MKYRKYINKGTDVERLDVKAYPTTTGKTFRVTGRRRVTPGQLEATVTAATAAEAQLLFETGEVPGVGLGWRVISVEEIV